MKTLEQIKNDYAKVHHYDNWDSLLNKQESLANIEWHYNNIIEIAQKQALQNASEKAHEMLEMLKEHLSYLKSFENDIAEAEEYLIFKTSELIKQATEL